MNMIRQDRHHSLTTFDPVFTRDSSPSAAAWSSDRGRLMNMLSSSMVFQGVYVPLRFGSPANTQISGTTTK